MHDAPEARSEHEHALCCWQELSQVSCHRYGREIAIAVGVEGTSGEELELIAVQEQLKPTTDIA
jgi:hypothetical protein